MNKTILLLAIASIVSTSLINAQTTGQHHGSVKAKDMNHDMKDIQHDKKDLTKDAQKF